MGCFLLVFSVGAFRFEHPLLIYNHVGSLHSSLSMVRAFEPLLNNVSEGDYNKFEVYVSQEFSDFVLEGPIFMTIPAVNSSLMRELCQFTFYSNRNKNYRFSPGSGQTRK